MCACADAGTTGAVPKWHYSRTKSTRPRESGTFGYGPYKDEPWSMMSIDKRAYGVRDFYKHVLEGTDTENPGWDSFVVDVLSMLRLVIGYKPTHVPKVSGVHGLRGGRLGAAGGFGGRAAIGGRAPPGLANVCAARRGRH